MGYNFGGEPRLVMPAPGVKWLNRIILGFLALYVVIVAGLAVSGALPLGYALLSCCGILVAPMLLWGILPRRFEIYYDRLVIVFGFGRWNIGFDSIEIVREAKPWQAYAYWGMRFATSPKQAT